MSSNEVKEGFLCPICMADLGDVIQLQVHFEEKHEKEDPAFIQNLKDLFGKAKKKILNDEMGGGGLGYSQQHGQQRSLASAAQDLLPSLTMDSVFGGLSDRDCDPVSGVHRHLLDEFPSKPTATDHTDFFKSERKKRLDRNKSTNQLLIRLERLLRNLPSDPLKRRLHEQSVVPWLPEEMVKLCPSCAKSFNIARRKHHCRLCGSVMCTDCSARKLVTPYGVSADPEIKYGAGSSSGGSTKLPFSSKLFGSKKISGSGESLNTIIGLIDLKSEHANQFRTCKLCREILAQQELKAEYDVPDEDSASSSALLVLYYDRLQLHMREGTDMSKRYLAMTESLHRGEEEFKPEHAKQLRMRLLRISENVGAMAKQIATLNTTQPLELKLQQRIRIAAVDFVKESLVALPAAPSEEEFEKLRAGRVRKAERKVAEEKEAARLAKAKFEEHKAQQEAIKKMGLDRIPLAGSRKKTLTKADNNSSSHVTLGSGFVLSSTQDRTSSDDPMVQQIQNIRGFIQEAKRLRRYDEVTALENNLRELQVEYRRSLVEKRELEENYKDFKGLFHKTSPAKKATDGYLEAVDMDEYDASGKNPFFDDE